MEHGKKPWNEEEKEFLMRKWQQVASITAFALHFSRSLSSVQTQVNRLSLPHRPRDPSNHYRPWRPEDEKQLFASIQDLALEDGRIPIWEVAQANNRSIDAVVAKLGMRGMPITELKDQLYVNPDLFEHIADDELLTDLLEKEEATVDSKKKSTVRACLNCGTQFWSEWIGNRICGNCKSDEAWD